MQKLRIAVYLAVGIYVAAALAITLVGLRDYAVIADLIVVPGNTVQADGSLSERLKSRLDTALRLFHAKCAPRIFVSGGIGREGHDEAVAMATYLIAHGVPANAIVRDSLGVNTAATAATAAQYLRTHKLQSAIIATQYFHIARTRLALQRNGVDVTGTVHARYFELRDIYSLAREVLGYAVYYATL